MFKKKAVKKRGGGMMGPKKKLAKGGALKKARDPYAVARARKPSGRLNVDDIKRAMPTGRSAAAKKAAMKGTKSGKKAALMGSIMQGKGNPAGKDMSMMGRIRSVLTNIPKRKRRLGPQGGRKRKK
jgi:hypothetical protein